MQFAAPLVPAGGADSFRQSTSSGNWTAFVAEQFEQRRSRDDDPVAEANRRNLSTLDSCVGAPSRRTARASGPLNGDGRFGPRVRQVAHGCLANDRSSST